VEDDGSAELVMRWQNGDQDAARELFQRYSERLMALAKTRLSAKVAIRANAEDVIQSVYRSFFVKAKSGRYVFERSGDLWRLLVAITLQKVRRQIEVHTAQKRNIHLEYREQPGWPSVSSDALAREPSPAEGAALADELERIMDRLEASHRKMLELRLQGYNLDEIAAEMGVSTRTVKRGLQRIRQLLENEQTET
jgi:RNA polymerase sigma-70 factor (ECF subfamily)